MIAFDVIFHAFAYLANLFLERLYIAHQRSDDRLQFLMLNMESLHAFLPILFQSLEI